MLCHPKIIACLLIAFAAPHQVLADEKADPDDPVAKIAARIPATWKVNLVGGARGTVICIETNPMDTVPSATSSALNREERATVIIEFEVLPKYSTAMLKRIREHNEPISARLKKVSYRSSEGRELAASMIPYPLFQDAQYSYRVIPPDRVPSRGEDRKIIERVLFKACSGWKPVEKGGRVVGEIMEYFSPG